ncbi:MAG: ABC transporter ATP-binding protein [Oscillospiraceae bacterium]|nr:ABC transporter ATP-binding protein [Oscillospiraceae bacterium]
MDALLTVNGLHVSFDTYAGRVQAVRGVDLTVGRGEILAVVGESGCGKSVTAQTIMRLNPSPPCRIDAGSVEFEGRDLTKLPEREMRKLRGSRIGMIFQDPMTSLDPTKQVGYQIIEAIRRHEKVTQKDAYARSVEMLELVGINNPTGRMKQYPHEFSGGMRQRAMIAMSLVCHPDLLIADEPTTALDVTIQAQILDLLLALRERLGTSILLITHDMGVVADVADRVMIMYAGMVMETGTVKDVFYDPQHPYTWGLQGSIPKHGGGGERLSPIDGTPPDLLAPPEGCPFADRCAYAMGICHERMPEVAARSESHTARCWLYHELAPKVTNPITGGTT